MAETCSGLGIIAEPYWVPPNHPCWAVSRCGRAAITWRVTDEPVPCSRLESGDGFVAARWGLVVVVGVYIPPARSLDIPGFEAILDNLRDCLVRYLPREEVLLAGDFNAKATLWGSPATDRRRAILLDWAAGLGMVCVNTGAVQTCVRQTGGSIVDLT
ncbi:uncharacterized protein [Temnothorax longispinosus]|uniref:uncharacterized protein n=1 Tax=Temnothorax longispinosus TaxID=300112 RepID=UPI003A997E35